MLDYRKPSASSETTLASFPMSSLAQQPARSSSKLVTHSVSTRSAASLLRKRSASGSSAHLLDLQRLYGNRYVQRMISLSRSQSDAEVDPEVEAGIQRQRGRGQQLGHSTRASMESAFGSDFSGVRIHTNGEADHLNHAVGAVAFTTGDDIFFSHGAYNPDTSGGKELLAHELTHVVQQSGNTVQGKMVLGEPGDHLEREAEAVAKQVTSAPTAAAARQCDCGGPGVNGGQCESCGQELENALARSLAPSVGNLVQRWPGDGMKPPGDCSWAKYAPLRAAVAAAKALVKAGGACNANDSCATLAIKIAAVAAEIAARFALMTVCFKGGDDKHRIELQNKINMLNRCYRFFTSKNCPAYLATAAASAVAAAAVSAIPTTAAATGTAAVTESVITAGELAEGVAATGEAVETGIGVTEVLEILALIVL